MTNFIIYAYKESNTNTESYDVPIMATIGQFLSDILQTCNKVLFGNIVLNNERFDTTLADIGLCPENTVVITNQNKESIWWDFINRHEDAINWSEIAQHSYLKQWMIDQRDSWDYPELSKCSDLSLVYIEKHLEENWSFEAISKENKNLTKEFIDKHQDKDWNYSYLFIRDLVDEPLEWTHLTKLLLELNMIEKYIDYPLDFDYISNSQFNVADVILKYPDKPWTDGIYKGYSKFNAEYIEKNIDKPWDWNKIYFWFNQKIEPSITEEFIIRHIDKCDLSHILMVDSNLSFSFIEKFIKKYEQNEIIWNTLSYNPNLPESFIKENGDKSWDYITIFVSNPNISYEFILENLDEEICFEELEEVNIDVLLKYPDLEWNWDNISSIIPFKYVKKYPHLPWSYTGLSHNSEIESEFVLEHRYESWDWYELTGVMPIPLNVIEQKKEWGDDVYDFISNNPDLPLEWIDRNPEAMWNWDIISSIKFNIKF